MKLGPCPLHPKYKAIRKPKDCVVCLGMYTLKQLKRKR